MRFRAQRRQHIGHRLTKAFQVDGAVRLGIGDPCEIQVAQILEHGTDFFAVSLCIKLSYVNSAEKDFSLGYIVKAHYQLYQR